MLLAAIYSITLVDRHLIPYMAFSPFRHQSEQHKFSARRLVQKIGSYSLLSFLAIRVARFRWRGWRRLRSRGRFLLSSHRLRCAPKHSWIVDEGIRPVTCVSRKMKIDVGNLRGHVQLIEIPHELIRRTKIAWVGSFAHCDRDGQPTSDYSGWVIMVIKF